MSNPEPHAMLSIRAITFDLDDTLWAIGPVIERAERVIYRWLSVHCPRVAEQFTLADMQRARSQVFEEHPDHTHDLSRLRWLAFEKVLAAAGYGESMVDRVFDEFMRLRNEVELFPDALPALERLSQAYPLASLTNGNADLELIGIRQHFTATVSARDHGVAKPHSDIFHAACSVLGCEPREVLHIGDSPEHDVLGAVEAGLRSVWLNRRGDVWLHPRTADIEASDLLEVLGHLGL
jgi:putative hydrolase of the HAD superfamily